MLSTNFDANLEWYFMPRGLVSLGAYSMNLKDYVAFGTQTQMLYSELSNQLEAYQVAVPVNADGKVYGMEFAYEQPLGENFGLNANYTYADGSTSHLGRRQQQPAGYLEEHLQRGCLLRE